MPLSSLRIYTSIMYSILLSLHLCEPTKKFSARAFWKWSKETAAPTNSQKKKTTKKKNHFPHFSESTIVLVVHSIHGGARGVAHVCSIDYLQKSDYVLLVCMQNERRPRGFSCCPFFNLKKNTQRE